MRHAQVFNFKENEVRMVVYEEAPWWVAKDVCDVLDIQNNRQAMDSLEEDEKLTYVLYTSGQNRAVWMINEPGLYSLILRSRKPEAKDFKRWITHEVLPTIRKTGIYVNTGQVPTVPMLTDQFEKFDQVNKLLQMLRMGYRDEIFNEATENAIRLQIAETIVGKSLYVLKNDLSAKQIKHAQAKPEGRGIKDIANSLGVTYQKAVWVAKKNNLKKPEYGAYHTYDYKGQQKEIFIYNDAGKGRLCELLNVQDISEVQH